MAVIFGQISGVIRRFHMQIVPQSAEGRDRREAAQASKRGYPDPLRPRYGPSDPLFTAPMGIRVSNSQRWVQTADLANLERSGYSHGKPSPTPGCTGVGQQWLCRAPRQSKLMGQLPGADLGRGRLRQRRHQRPPAPFHRVIDPLPQPCGFSAFPPERGFHSRRCGGVPPGAPPSRRGSPPR